MGSIAALWFHDWPLGLVLGRRDDLQHDVGRPRRHAHPADARPASAWTRRSAPGRFLTTTTDVLGFFSFLGLCGRCS